MTGRERPAIIPKRSLQFELAPRGEPPISAQLVMQVAARNLDPPRELLNLNPTQAENGAQAPVNDERLFCVLTWHAEMYDAGEKHRRTFCNNATR